MFRIWMLALALGVVALAGCADDPKPQEAESFDDLKLQATEDTGVLRGVVVDSAIRPLAGAKITLIGPDGEQEATTGEEGLFGFQDLTPGTYFVKATKIGYTETQSSAEVVAGVADPPVVRMLLESDPAGLPSYSVIHFSGFLECSFVAGFFFIPCSTSWTGPIGNDYYEDIWATGGELDHIHVSLVWEPTQPFGTELYMNLYEPDAYDIVAWNGGPSPVTVDANATALASINAAGNFSLEVATNGESVALSLLGASYQQEFDAYIVLFDNFVPEEDYAYWSHGEPKRPE